MTVAVNIARAVADMVKSAYERGLSPSEVDALLRSDEFASDIRGVVEDRPVVVNVVHNIVNSISNDSERFLVRPSAS